MITDSFDFRTLAEMEMALDRACKTLPSGGDHEVRRHVAARILQCAERGGCTLDSLTDAGRVAASELSVAHGV